jgi:hypothetical protein
MSTRLDGSALHCGIITVATSLTVSMRNALASTAGADWFNVPQ